MRHLFMGSGHRTRRRFIAAAAGVIAALVAVGCGPRREPTYVLNGSTMGTEFSVTLVGDPTNQALDGLEEDVRSALDAVNQSMSTYVETSEVSRFNRYEGIDRFPVSAGLCSVVAAALRVGAVTDGAFDISIAPAVNLWGFGPGGPNRVPGDDAIEEALQNAGSDAVAADCGDASIRKNAPMVQIDLSAIAKGYAVDRVAALLEDRGFGNFLVEIGGEIRASGTNADGDAWRVAIEAPDLARRGSYAVVELTDIGVATSGDYRNYFERDGRRFAHIIDPRTGRPATGNVASVTVLASSAMLADAYATALLVMGRDEALALATWESLAVLMLVRTDAGFEACASPTFPLPAGVVNSC